MTDENIYMNERQDKIYYSEGDAVTGTDLYTMDKLLDTFGNEKRLPGTINKEGSQAFPFVLSDGMTLYFASTGEPSFGGYDLFVTRYNLTSDSYLNPNQLNMPFNSPFNDYMLAIDEEKGIGWFASDRFNRPTRYVYIPLSRTHRCNWSKVRMPVIWHGEHGSLPLPTHGRKAQTMDRFVHWHSKRQSQGKKQQVILHL
jgi:hypothetical protein